MRDREDLIAEMMETLWTFLGIGLLMLVGAWLLLKLRSRLQDDAGSATTSHEMLTQIRDLRRQGDLSEEEYRSIKGRLVGRLDGSLSAPPPTGSDSSGEPSSQEPAAGQPAGNDPDDENDERGESTTAGDEARR